MATKKQAAPKKSAAEDLAAIERGLEAERRDRKATKTKKSAAKKSAPKAKQASAKKEAPAEKQPGVIATVRAMMERKQGASVAEIMERLTAEFPDRKPDSMIKTARIQVRRLYKTLNVKPDGMIEDTEARGRVYRLPNGK